MKVDDMHDERKLLEAYVAAGKLMQLATRDAQGPWLCNVWYLHDFDPDSLWFMSNASRTHSRHIREDGPVAGSIVHEVPEELGQKARGITFRGAARELPTKGVEGIVTAFCARWPKASAVIDTKRLAGEETPMRLYEIRVSEWILVDEVNLPDEPRRVIPGA